MQVPKTLVNTKIIILETVEWNEWNRAMLMHILHERVSYHLDLTDI